MSETSSPLRILVVEDDAPLLGYLCALLAGWGHECIPTRSTLDALSQVRQRCPDVVISDLVMPGMNGVELLRAIRHEKACDLQGGVQCALCFVLITGQGSVTDAVRAVMEGADDVLVKPLDENRLQEILERCVAAKKKAGVAACNGSGQ